MRRLILRSHQSPGDIVMLTAAVRDLHQAAPGQFQTDVRTSAPALWENNPYLTPLQETESGVETIPMHYPLIHQSNHRPYHFLHGYPQYLEERLGLRIPITRYSGDIHLTTEEKVSPPPCLPQQTPQDFWILVAGGKYDFTAKWWDPDAYQAVVDHFRGRLTFLQVGEAGHWHPKLKGVVDLIGKTSTRDFIRLMYHAAGVVCPVTFAMHLAAAVPTKPGHPKSRPCVVVAGGREPPHWEAYPQHQFLSTVGMLPCCAEGGCWRSRCQLVGDGDMKDRTNLCENPVQIRPDLRIPQCLHLITADDVIRKIDLYLNARSGFQAPAFKLESNGHARKSNSAPARADPTNTEPSNLEPEPRTLEPLKMTRANPRRIATRNVLIRLGHGLGDAVQLTVVLQHLRRYRPDWAVDVICLRGKHSARLRMIQAPMKP